jgi:hypothetical protein
MAMRRISSRMTFFYKRILPLIFCGVFVIFVVVTWIGLSRSPGQFPGMPFLIVPVLIFAFIFFVMKKMIFDLVDEVLDGGDALIVRNRGREDRVTLANIMNVNYSPFINPPRVTLTLRQPSVFGNQITFCAPVRFVPFSTSPLVDELIGRIDAARRR